MIRPLTAVVLLSFPWPLSAQSNLSPLQFLPGDSTIAPAAGDQQFPAIVRGGAMFLAAWQDNRAGNSGQDIYAARLDAAGNLIDAVPFVVSQPAADQTNPR